MITVRCKDCGKELISASKTQFCGCPNQMSIVDNKIGAKDMDKIVMVTNNLERKIDSHFSRSELLYQEERRKRKVKRLDFEVR
jgi:phage FluMu protein Com|tara:strand:+ start:70 stop:318 length:249 start_codon:yes stop_codon:yes gene_type:complete